KKPRRAAKRPATDAAPASGERKRSRRKEPSPDAVLTGTPAMRRPWRMLLAVLTGVLVFTSFPFRTEPDTNLWPLPWFALVPLFWALRGGVSRKQAFYTGWLAGFVTNFGGFWWI